VLPAAIENDLLIAISPSQTPDGVVTVENTDPKFTKASFSAAKNSDGEWQLDINPQALRWEGYVKAGYLVSICLHVLNSTHYF
jgi:galactokinase